MLHTYLTTSWGLRYPIIGAPMVGVGRGRLARAVSEAGGLGMIGIGTEPAELIAREAAIARGTDQGRFGIGLMTWAIEKRPDLLEAAIEAHPFLLSLSFGSPAPYVERLHQHGILLATQVNTRAEAVQAVGDKVDLIVVQGVEAGGHVTGQVSTLPLLQAVLDAVQVPVLVAGGIATPHGVAAALAAGAEGVWVGTCLLASPECEHVEQARVRILQAQETDTILTRAFDVAQGLAWPEQYPGRALRNHFTQQWHDRLETLPQASEARQQLATAIANKNYDVASIYAGEAVGLVTRQQPAGEVIHALGNGAERLLRTRSSLLLDGYEASSEDEG
ncbi:NAD(P)H-dependent flavin oxidoreductase [Ktedonobacter racemifer]|uniref:2-nitropropane dioxygenase NPD n=1 Tax=Ktedonobacter racemifer DSM 44963 TaxID=485913 RepID=D6U1D0_KTERA|nr:nitronate monooxygenase [Ktedonobacter racemifer]EFH80781.1 2-nitropropane dioxygenase NPD [Ktedonobacter racemifer DSM 44963]